MRITQNNKMGVTRKIDEFFAIVYVKRRRRTH